MSVANERKGPISVTNDVKGIKGELTGVARSNPAQRTILPSIDVGRINLPATMTPSWLGRDMVALANIQVGDDILEPSAGNGAIVKEILDHMPDNCYVVAIELNKKLFNELKQVSETWRFDPVCGDFLLNPLYMRAGYNRIVMNPPHRKCIAHIEKAASLLRHGGRLVALVHSVYLDEIKKILPDVIIRPLPSETFVIEGNYIEAAVIVIDKGDGE